MYTYTPVYTLNGIAAVLIQMSESVVLYMVKTLLYINPNTTRILIFLRLICSHYIRY